MGDGNLSNPNGRATRLRISCDLKYPYLIGKVKRALQEGFPDNKIGIVRRRQKCLDVSCFSNKLENLLGWKAKAGSKFAQKARVPKWIAANDKFTARCLCGLIETDGSIYTDRGYKMVNFVTIIHELAIDAEQMFKKLGFQPKLYKIIPRNTGYNSKIRYNLRLSKNVNEFLKIVNPQKF